MTLSTIKNYALAIELITLGARINIIAEETGLSPKILRKAYIEMHQKSPSRGSNKITTNFIYKSLFKSKQATMFVFFFRIETNQEFPRRCINAYKKYEAYIFTVLKSQPAFDISDCWMLAKWSTCGIIKLIRCGNCRSAKLINNHDQQNICCICRS